MFEHIADAVESHITEFKPNKSKSEILTHFGLGSPGFNTLFSELQQQEWFKHKRKNAVEEIIQQSVAGYLHKSK